MMLSPGPSGFIILWHMRPVDVLWALVVGQEHFSGTLRKYD
jgi:hypothetical protein